MLQVPQKNNHKKIAISDLSQFELDTLDLFSNKRAGHMGKWQYGPSAYKGDPAGGGVLWDDFIRHPNQYYIPAHDASLIHAITKDLEFINILNQYERIAELGPGGRDAVILKTLPLLKLSNVLKEYISIDASAEFSAGSEKTIKEFIACQTRSVVGALGSPVNLGKNPVFLLCFGSTLSNLEGALRDNPRKNLIKFIKQIFDTLPSGSAAFITYDTCRDQDQVMKAYHEPLHRRFGINGAYRFRRDQIVKGLDPQAWYYEPVWSQDNFQAAHTIVAGLDQEIEIAKHRFHVTAGTRFIMNNSYKFNEWDVMSAAQSIGLSVKVFRASGSHMAGALIRS